MDVHVETIAVAVAEGRNLVRSLRDHSKPTGCNPTTAKEAGKPSELSVCYEAGPTGYVLYWQLAQLGIQCDVVAPSLIPTKASDRVKTDRRDAEKLARAYRSGDLTSVWVPNAEHEALRDLVRAREAAKDDERRAKHRLGKYLLRYGQPGAGCRAWTAAWWQWARGLKLTFENQNITLLEYIMEVDSQSQRIARLDGSIDRAVDGAPRDLRVVVELHRNGAIGALKRAEEPSWSDH
jgi:transposase